MSKAKFTFNLAYTLHYNRATEQWFVVCEKGTFYIQKKKHGYYAAGKTCRTLRDGVIAVLLLAGVIPERPF